MVPEATARRPQDFAAAIRGLIADGEPQRSGIDSSGLSRIGDEVEAILEARDTHTLPIARAGR